MSLENANISYAIQRLNLERNVTQFFYNVFMAQKNLAIAQEELVNTQKSYDIIKNKVDAGLAAKEEFYQAELNLSTSKSGLQNNEVAYENAKDQFAGGGRGVDGLGEGAEADPLPLQGFHSLDELLEGAGEAVELPDHKGVARAHVVEGAGQLGAVPLGAGGGLGEDPGTAHLGEGIELEVGRLVLGRDPAH